MFENYYNAVKFIESLDNLPPKQIEMRLNLKRFRYFLNLIGNPQNGFKYIHVTGTSGKGSVVAIIHSILTEAGFKTGAFFSPHTTTTIERIKVNRKYISPQEFSDIVNFITPQITEAYLNSPYGRPNYFEIILAIAFLYFKKCRCEYVVLEAFCGGRYDQTNVILDPKFTIITNINFDHTELLGKTLKKIAYQKAGIIKPNSVFLTAETKPHLIKYLKNYCLENQAQFYQVKTDLLKIEYSKFGLSFQFKNDFLTYQIPLIGKHQIKNAALAITLAKKLGINANNIINGLKHCQISCRLETMQKNPLVIIDGAHNPSKIKVIADSIKNLTYKKLFLIIGISQSKDYSTMLESVIPLADYVFITRNQVYQKKAASLKKLAHKTREISNNKINPKICLNPFDALNSALEKAKKNDLILITGSLYLAGELRTRWIPEEQILRKRTSF